MNSVRGRLLPPSARRAHRSFLPLVLGVIVSIHAATPGAADDPTLTLSKGSGGPTYPIRITGKAFAPNESVAVSLDSIRMANDTTGSTGNFSLRVRIPLSATPGPHLIVATGQTSGLTAQAPFLVQTPWAQFRHDPAHTGYNPVENVLDASNVVGLRQIWSASTGGAASSSPAVTQGRAFVGSGDGSLYAVDEATGATLWAFSTGGPITSSPVVAGGMLYVGSGDHKVYAINPSDGSLSWSAGTGGNVNSSPTVVSGVVYVGSFDGNLYAFNAKTGAVLWSQSLGGPVTSSPTVTGGMVYVGSHDHNVYALRAGTGAVAWVAPTTGIVGDVVPAVANGMVYVGSSDAYLYALDASTGAVRWSFATGAPVTTSVAVANGIVYLNSPDEDLYALNSSTGTIQWTAGTTFGLHSSPAVANGLVYATAFNLLYEFDASTGALISSDSVGLVNDSPSVTNGRVFLTAGTNLVALSL